MKQNRMLNNSLNVSKPTFLICMITVFVVLLNVNANADASITYNFKNEANELLSDVDFLVYNCNDVRCNSVSIPNFVNGNNHGNSNDNPPNHDIIVNYPRVLETRFGYATYFYKDGYLPMEYFENWAGNGQRTFDIVFLKKSSCSSHIENFQIINSENPNLPIQIRVLTKLDASTYSAFQSNPNTPGFVPEQFKDHYSALTRVTLNIYDSTNNLVHTETKLVNLFMDSQEEINFNWTPRNQDNYKAEIITDVVDNQCSSTIPVSVSSQFSVVRSSLDKCYTLLNNLRTSIVNPSVNQETLIIANKISNYRDNSGKLTALETNLDFSIYDENANLVDSQSRLLPSNPNTLDPVEFSFSWIPNKEGLYTIKLKGIAESPICNNKENLEETETLNLLVKSGGRNALTLFTIGNRQVTENEQLAIDIEASYTGSRILAFTASNLPDGASIDRNTGLFTFSPTFDTVPHSLLNDIKRFLGQKLKKEFLVTFRVSDGVLADEQFVKITVFDKNRDPLIGNIPDITVDEGTLIILNPTVSDPDNDNLKIVYSSPLNRNGEWQTRAGDSGVYFSKVRVIDDFGGEASLIVKINVLGPSGTSVRRFQDRHQLSTKSLVIENDKVTAGDFLYILSKVKNEGDSAEKDIRLRVTIPDLGIVEQRTLPRLSNNDQKTFTFIINIPEQTSPGFYALKYQIFNSKSQETEAVEFQVI